MDILTDLFQLQKEVLQYQSKGDGEALELLVNIIPTVVVIGGQSTGKSSLVEALIGHSFLPRGFGIVTRRPLFIEVKPSEKLYFTVGGEEMDSEEEVRNRISSLMNVKENVFVSGEPIYISVFSPTATYIALIDLPGLTKLPLKDQPCDIVHTLSAIVQRYISPKNHIILAVSAANADLATSDALTAAAYADPEGNRTIGVLCKCDLVEKGQDLNRILNNEVHSLKHGYYGVISTCDNDENEVGIYPGREKEMSMFDSMAKFADVQGGDRLGVTNLRMKIVCLMLHKMKKFIPEINDRLLSIRHRAQTRISRMEPLMASDKSETSLLLLLINKFYGTLNDMVRGQHMPSLTLKNLEGGAKLRKIFVDDLRRNLKAVEIMSSVKDDDILIAVQNASGTNASLFLTSQPFEYLVRNEIPKFAQPSINCLDQLYGEMSALVLTALRSVPDISLYPKLAEAILDESKSVLEACMKPTKTMICNLIEIEMSFIDLSNTHGNHSNMQRGAYNLESHSNKLNSRQLITWSNNSLCKSPIWTEGVKVRFIKELATEYLENIRQSLICSIPKTIVRFFISEFLSQIQSSLTESLYNKRSEYLKQSDQAVIEFNQHKMELKFVNRACKLIQDIKYKIITSS